MAGNKYVDPDKIIDYSIDYYGVLGLKREDVPEGTGRDILSQIATVLERAYQKAAIKYHPDFGRTEEEKAELDKQFRLIFRAHTILSNPIWRKIYDTGGEWRPKQAGDGNGNALGIDWSKVGTYREGTLAETIGNGLFLEICKRAKELGIVPAFFPTSEDHNYEWDWVVSDVTVREGQPTKLALSIVYDEDDMLRLTSGATIQDSLPFKLYMCLPRASLVFLRTEPEEFYFEDQEEGSEPAIVLAGQLKAAGFSDFDLLETTNLEEARAYVAPGGGLDQHLAQLRDGSLIERQMEIDAENEGTQFMTTDEIKRHDAETLKAILMAKASYTHYDPRAADFIDKLPDKLPRKKVTG